MIMSFATQETELIFRGCVVEGLSPRLQDLALLKLQVLAAAVELRDLEAMPSNRFELLRGEREGYHCIAVYDLARICFLWEGGHAHKVEIFGYQ